MSHNTSVAAVTSPSEKKLHVTIHDTDCRDTVEKKVYSTVCIFGDMPSSKEAEPPEETPDSSLLGKLKALLLIAP